MRAPRIHSFPVLLALVLAASPLAAQRREATISAGVNYTGATGPQVKTSESRMGVQGGFTFRIPHSPKLSFQAGVFLVQRRVQAERAPSTAPPLTVGPRADAPSILFAHIPLAFRFEKGYSTERPIRPYLVLGGFVGVRLACRRDLTEADGTTFHTDCSISPKNRPPSTDPFLPARYQDLDAGFLGEIGLEIRRFSLGVRGIRSMGNVIDAGAIPTSPLDRAKLWTVSLSVDYLFRAF